MLRAIRRSRLRILLSLSTLVTTCALAIVDSVHGGSSDDALCRPTTVVQHDSANHRIEPSSSAKPGPAHCYICHWVRLLTPSTARHRLLEPANSGDTFTPKLVASRPAGRPDRQIPARAPPSNDPTGAN